MSTREVFVYILACLIAVAGVSAAVTARVIDKLAG